MLVGSSKIWPMIRKILLDTVQTRLFQSVILRVVNTCLSRKTILNYVYGLSLVDCIKLIC